MYKVTENEFYGAVRSILGDVEWDNTIKHRLISVEDLCKTIAEKVFIDDIEGSFFLSDINIVKKVAKNIHKTGESGLLINK